jgi:hypothetical protein
MGVDKLLTHLLPPEPGRGRTNAYHDNVKQLFVYLSIAANG